MRRLLTAALLCAAITPAQTDDLILDAQAKGQAANVALGAFQNTLAPIAQKLADCQKAAMSTDEAAAVAYLKSFKYQDGTTALDKITEMRKAAFQIHVIATWPAQGDTTGAMDQVVFSAVAPEVQQ